MKTIKHENKMAVAPFAAGLKSFLKASSHTRTAFFCFACILFFMLFSFFCTAQNCPPNIDFENGDFTGWLCHTGHVKAVGTANKISFVAPRGAIANRHTMYGPGSRETDYYGHFPVHSPNGSGHSVKLGNNKGGGLAEGLSYEFTIPANQNSYVLTYNYAVVFQAPDHQENEQPRMEAEITNMTDSTVIDCASFTFIAVGTTLTGFELSDRRDTADVLFKNWTKVSVNLTGLAGKKIRLFFKTADCTFKAHFGYAYIDVNSDCSSNLEGATFCPDDTLVNIAALPGYQSYTWYDSSMAHVLGTGQSLILAPPPPAGTSLALLMQPYPGFGCPTLVYTQLKDSLTVVANAGKDALSCNGDAVRIGTVPRQGQVYKWQPQTGLDDPGAATPFASPAVTTNYVLTTGSRGGGCQTRDTVQVVASSISSAISLAGKERYCFGHGDSSVLEVSPAHRINWYKDGALLAGATNSSVYRVNQTGAYAATLINELGCASTTAEQSIVVDYDKAGIAYPTKYAIKNYPLVLFARAIGEKALWQPAGNLNDAASFKPTFLGNTEQLYFITITSRGGCVATDTQFVKAIERVEVYVPSAFTPNFDGRNDYLRPIARGIAEIKSFKIFNRRGQLLFQGGTESQGWDGNFKGQPQDTQAIVWVLECTGLDGKAYQQQGSSVLIR